MKKLLVLLLLVAGCRPAVQPTVSAAPSRSATVSPPTASLVVRQTRPRIWLTPDRLAWLKANQGRLEWKRLLVNCEDGWTRDTYNSALNYALAWKITGDRRYAAKAAQLCELYIAMGTDAMTKVGAVSPYGFGARIVLPEVSASYDWLSDYLDAETKKRWADQLMAWSDWVWQESAPPDPTRKWWSQHNEGDNFYSGYLCSLIAALAVYGEHPRAQYHLDLGQVKLAALVDYLKNYGRGGVSLEGSNYGTFLRQMEIFAALSTATDQNLFADPTFSFPADLAKALWPITAPDRKHLHPFGGQPIDASAPITEDHRGSPLIALSYGDDATKALAKSWLDGTGATRKRQNSWQEALWYDNRVRATNWRLLPLTYHAVGSGFVSTRSSWEPDATWIVFQCGAVLESHQDYAAGEFAIWKNGEWLCGPARLWGIGGGMHPSDFCNVLLIGKDGAWKGQPGQVGSGALPKTTMKVTSVTQAPGVVTITCDATRAYDYYKSARVWPVLSSWTRTLLYRLPNRLIVTDRVSRLNPLDGIAWQLHVKNPPNVVGASYTITGANGHLVGTLRGPADAALGVVPISKGPGGALSSYRLQATVPPSSGEAVIVNELEVVP